MKAFTLVVLLCAAAVLIAPLGPAFAQETGGTGATEALSVPSVSQAILLALENGYDVEQAEQKLVEATLHEASVKAALGLRVDASGGDTYSKRIIQVDPTTGLPMPGEPYFNTVYGALSVRTTLAPGPEAALDLRQAAIQVQNARLDLEQTMKDTAVAVYEAYYQLETALLQLRVADEMVENARAGWTIAESRRRDDAVTAEDVEEARLTYRESAVRRDSARRMLEIAKRSLAHLIGIAPESIALEDLPVPDFDALLETIRKTPERFAPKTPFPWELSRDQLVARGAVQRPEVRQAQNGVALAEDGMKRARLIGRPRISATAEYAWSEKAKASVSFDNDWLLTGSISQNESWQEGIDGTVPTLQDEPTWNAGIRVTVNLWDSHVQTVAEKRAETGAAMARSALEQAKNGIELDINRRHADALAAFDTLHLSAEKVLLAHAKLETERERFARGLGTDIEIDVQVAALHQAVVDALSARRAYETSVLRLAVSSGATRDEIQELVSRFQRGLSQ